VDAIETPPEETGMTRWISIFLMCLVAACSRTPESAGSPAAPRSAPEKTLRAVGDIPALHGGGRVMPLDTYSRLLLLQLSGRKSVGDESALAWMMRLLIYPETTETDLVFLVEHPDVLSDLNVPLTQAVPGKRKPSTRRFSFQHLQPGFPELQRLATQAMQMEEEDRGLVETEAIRLFENVMLYKQMAQVFAFDRDLPGLEITSPEVLEALGLTDGSSGLSYLDLRPNVSNLVKLIEEAPDAEDGSDWTPAQREAFAIASFVRQAEQGWSALPFPILPEAPHGEDSWVTPFDAVAHSHGDRDLANAGRRTARMVSAWRDGDWDTVQAEAEAVIAFSRSRMDHLRGTGLTSREARFNRANYFGKAKVFYILAFFLSMGALVSGSTKLRLAAWVPLVCALFLHVVGICWRIYLTARPPVTNLYGTFLFVGLVCLLLALLVEYFQKDALGIFAGSFIAITFLFVADRFGAEGDTLNKVVAVLASNFWLSTHVLAVTTGYAGVWIAGVFGHLWLLFKLMGKPKALMESVRLPLEGLLGFGLTFAFLGTMLGGVWADQSWGRFWGWDPKENGALLIVLWTAALYHARVAGMIGEKGMAAGSVGGCIMVMVAWLGVNLLGVGLHSYGFTTAMKSLFVGYILFEVIFLVVCLGLIRLQEQRTSVQPA
jgi:ABC-type transport system involved in cytochrome c biogenesis permease subunit